MASKRLVLDANILIRAVLGVRVRSLVEAYCERVAFFVAEANVSRTLGKHVAAGFVRLKPGVGKTKVPEVAIHRLTVDIDVCDRTDRVAVRLRSGPARSGSSGGVYESNPATVVIKASGSMIEGGPGPRRR